jgi:hypothetical protein
MTPIAAFLGGATIVAATVAGSSSALATAQAHPASKSVAKYVSPVNAGGHLKPGYKVVTNATGGTCSPGSDTGVTAYRCFSGSFVYDPCWATTGDPSGRSVICLPDPLSKKVWRISHLDSVPSPLTPFHPKDHPWGLTLAGGNRCSSTQGARDTFQGRTMSYRCNNNVMLLDPLDTSKPLWRPQTVIFDASISGYHLGPIRPITIRWYAVASRSAAAR